MIVDAILSLFGWFFTILWWPLAFIPDGTQYIERLSDVLEFYISYSYGWDFLLPVSEALLIFRLSIVIWFGISIYYAVIYIMKLFRGN